MTVNKSKKIFKISAALGAVIFFCVPKVIFSADYQSLVPINLPNNSPIPTTNLPAYLVGIFTLAVALAGALAVIRIIYGGIRYMSTDSLFDKSEGKKIIQKALIGLLLAMSAYAILYTINPQLLDLNVIFNSTATTNIPSSSSGNSSGNQNKQNSGDWCYAYTEDDGNTTKICEHDQGTCQDDYYRQTNPTKTSCQQESN